MGYDRFRKEHAKMADHTAIRFNVGIFGFLTSDGMQTEMIKSINSLLHEVHLRVADHIKPKQGRAGENASLDLYVCPKLAGDIWLKSFDDSDADFHCVTMDAADTSNPFVKNASSVTELGGGSIRIHMQDLQSKMFKMLGFSEEEAWAKFGYLLEAFRFGVPPHGGMAYGLDRMIMLMAGKNSIRDVIAFPKVQNASDPMTNAPDVVESKQLKELHIKVTE
jgi:hypothetical protein